METTYSLLWEEEFEGLINGLMDKGYGVSPVFLDPQHATALRSILMQHYLQNQMDPAGIGRKFDYQKNLKVRGDVIKWIDEQSSVQEEQLLLQKIHAFMQYLNRTCFTNLNACEFHYALYEKGRYYQKHLDQFKSNRGRKFSLVIYLNEDWREEDGGELVLYHHHMREAVSPTLGKAVFFRSDEVYHQVRPSVHKARLSIAGWLKNI